MLSQTGEVLGVVTALTTADTEGRWSKGVFVRPAETLLRLCPELRAGVPPIVQVLTQPWVEPWEPFQKYIVPPGFGHASQAMYELPRLQDAQTPREFIEPIELVQRQLVAHDPKLLIVVGTPGTGKSRLLAELARRICSFNNETSITEQIVPILVTARSFAEANGISVAEHLADSLNRDNKLQTLRRLDATAIEQLILDDRYRCLVMIDGADEVANPVNRKDLFKRVVSDGRMMLDERHLVILSTRPLYEVDDKVLRTTCLCYNLPVLDNDASDRLVRTTLGAKAEEFTLAVAT